MIFTPTEVEIYYSHRLPGLKKLSRNEARMPCPIHKGKNQNFSVNLETGFACCHSGCGGRGWDMISLEMELSGKDFGQAKESVYALVGRPQIPFEERDLETTYDYVDENGKLLYQVLRYHGKQFKQRQPVPGGGWKWSLEGVRRVPFRLDRLAKSQFVALVEGEKDVLSLERIGVVGTCTNGGAGSPLRPEQADLFAGKQVAIFADNDEPGREYAMKNAAALHGKARSVKIIELPDLPPKGDISDWLLKGGTKEQLREFYRKAVEWDEGWRFAVDIPDEHAVHKRRFLQVVEEAGGLTEFWNLAKLEGLQTPFARLSHSLGGGLRRGELYVLGGNQGSGKTSLALQFATTTIVGGGRVLLYSMEMDWSAIFRRMASMIAEVNLNSLMSYQIALKRKDIDAGEKQEVAAEVGRMVQKLATATASLVERDILVSNKTLVTPEYIVQDTKRISKSNPFSLLIVDHLQLMDCEGQHIRSEYERFTKISRMMKHVAVELNIPLLLVSQTSRNQSFEKRGELECSDLRGTGAIEEDAAAVLLLYEDQEDRKAALTEMKEGGGNRYMLGPVRSVLKIGKNRYGIQGQCLDLLHYKAFTKFEEGRPLISPKKANGSYRNYNETNERDVQ